MTAREWSDFLNPAQFLKYISKEENAMCLSQREMHLGNLIEVSGLPALTKVGLREGDTILWEGVSDIRGRALLFTRGLTVNGEEKRGKNLYLQIEGRQDYAFIAEPHTKLHLGDDAADKAAALDLMLMVDTTGSMGDELEYLKKELANVVETVWKLNPDLSIRVSVNFYRTILYDTGRAKEPARDYQSRHYSDEEFKAMEVDLDGE